LTHKLISDESEIKRFVGILPHLALDEVYFVSLSARNKYLTDKEKQEIGLGRAEMFNRRLVKCASNPDEAFDMYLRTIKSFECIYGGITTKSHEIIPDKCLVVYANINAVSGKKALRLFLSKAIDNIFDSTADVNCIAKMASLDSMLMNCYQQSRSTKKFIDIDFDIPANAYDLLVQFIRVLKENNITYYVIKTKSGYHVLMQTDTIKFNYNITVHELNATAQYRYGKEHVEVIQNKNEMIPVPGTYQGGFPVTFLDL
jgi:hypothetical protein